jgi:ribonuclease-3
LEFLGDAVLEIILTEYLYVLYPAMNEGDLTKIRSALAKEGTLAELAVQQNLGGFLRIGHGEQECGGAERVSTLADLFEAVLGAIYLDAGLDAARAYAMPLFRAYTDEPCTLLHSINPKGTLQEYAQRLHLSTPTYRILHISGPEHQPHYTVEVTLNNHSATGEAASRKQAESAAARKLYEFLTSTSV